MRLMKHFHVVAAKYHARLFLIAGTNVQKPATIRKNTVITSALFSFPNNFHADILPLFSVISNLKIIDAWKNVNEELSHVAMLVSNVAG